MNDVNVLNQEVCEWWLAIEEIEFRGGCMYVGFVAVAASARKMNLELMEGSPPHSVGDYRTAHMEA